MLTRRAAIAAFFAKPKFAVPTNACDCHTHIFGDPKKFPFIPARAYTPPQALPKQMQALHRRLHIDRVVIVTPSVYGADNSATLYGMKAIGASARGVAVIDDKSDLHLLADAGFQGIRLNLVTGVETDSSVVRRRIVAAIKRIRPHNWHLQIYTNAPLITAIKDLVQDSPIDVVFDHFGGAQASLGLNQPGFADLIDLLHSAKAYVKISGAYRAATNYAYVIPFAKALIAANPDRVIWGTDWPHPNTPKKIDDSILLNQLPLWSPDPEIRKKILVETPARLYRF